MWDELVIDLAGRLSFRLVLQMKNSPETGKLNLGAFHVSCWVMGLVAFAQLMSVGVAMATRGNDSGPAPEARVVEKYIMIPSSSNGPVRVAPPKLEPKAEPKPEPSIAEVPVEVPEDTTPEVHEFEVLNTPPSTADPLVEKLIEEAREARVMGDLMVAHAKLSEAEEMDPMNANVLYSLGTNFEGLGHEGEAAKYFLRVYQLGVLSAGSLYEKAGFKLAHGLVPDVKNLANLGWGRIAAPERDESGELRKLLLPVEISPNRDFDSQKLDLKVQFYEEVDGKVTRAIIKDGDLGGGWLGERTDWADGEEVAEAWYIVPDQDAASGLLFGERKFFGFVAKLYYHGRLVDVRAQPRTLGLHEETPESLNAWKEELDGLSIEDLEEMAAPGTVLPRIADPSEGLPKFGE